MLGDYDGADRPGDNLFSESIIAVAIDTGHNADETAWMQPTGTENGSATSRCSVTSTCRRSAGTAGGGPRLIALALPR